MRTRSAKKKSVSTAVVMSPAAVQDRACRTQSGASDCVVTCLGMITGMSNQQIIRDIYPHVDFDKGGLQFPQILDGLKALRLHSVETVHFLPKVPALVIVPGLNRQNALHCLCWDGFELCDPQRGKGNLKYYTANSDTRQLQPQKEIVKCLSLFVQ